MTTPRVLAGDDMTVKGERAGGRHGDEGPQVKQLNLHVRASRGQDALASARRTSAAGPATAC
jgi:hypothetical protein